LTRRILATALVSAASFAAVLGVPATADNPTPTATASTVPPAVETAPPAASPADVPTQTPTEAPTQPPAQDTAAAAPTETATDAPPVETPFPSPVDTTIPTVPPVATATADATAAATATATATETARRTRAANRSAGRNGQARACTAKGTGKLSTSTSASGCVEVKAPKTYTPPVHVPKLTNRDGSPASSNPSYALSVPGPAKIGVPNFFIDKFRIPPFLLPIYQAAGMQYGIRWEILAGINEIETDYGRNLNVSSAGALGWMQFMPATWKTYGVDANQDGVKDPFNPVDAIFAAARYLKAAGGDKDLRRGIFAYNHADWYVDSVLMRAQVIGGIPGDLIGSLTGLTQGRFPVRAKATYAGALKKADRRRKGANAAVVVESQANRRNIEIYARAGSPVIAVNDGKVTRIGTSKRLGRYITVQDVYGNSYTYAQLKTLAKLYPSPKPRTKKQSATGSLRRGVKTAAPSKSETESGADVKAAEKVTAAATTAKTAALAAKVRLFAHPDRKNARVAGGDSQLASGNTASDSAPLGLDPKDFVAKRLVKGARVLGGTTLGRIGKTGAQAPHLLFEIRPAGRGAPRIDPKPILDGWKLLESTEVYRAKGKNALFGADSNEPSIGQIMLMSKETLTRRVLEDPRIEIYGCGRADIRSGAIDRRVLATLAFLASSGLKPAVSSLQCGHGQMTSSGNVSEHTTGTAVDIAQINGIPIYGHQGPGSIADLTIQRLLTLQGTMKPHQIISLMTFDGADNTLAMADHADHIHIGWRPLYGENKAAARQIDAILKPKQWIKLIDRLGQIDNPTVAAAPSKYAVKVKPASD
jgi:hypothetical protein